MSPTARTGLFAAGLVFGLAALLGGVLLLASRPAAESTGNRPQNDRKTTVDTGVKALNGSELAPKGKPLDMATAPGVVAGDHFELVWESGQTLNVPMAEFGHFSADADLGEYYALSSRLYGRPEVKKLGAAFWVVPRSRADDLKHERLRLTAEEVRLGILRRPNYAQMVKQQNALFPGIATP